MKYEPLWKYCDAGQWKEMILRLELLDRRKWPDDKHLACLYAVSNHPERHYRPIQIPKRDKTPRQLYEPDSILKLIQKNILHHVLVPLPVSSYALAYRRGTGIKANASCHVHNEVVVKLDIENFFDHILFPMVLKAAFPAEYFPLPVRTLLTHLCCYQEQIPQGAPTSAAISNLVMKPFDEYIGNWCRERDIVYSRYCDDITCSGSFKPQMVIRKTAACLQELGFYLNDRKTAVIRQGRRQLVTGITVNDKPQVPNGYRRSLRQEIYYIKKYGAASHLQFAGDGRFKPDDEVAIRKYLQSLLGKVNFILYINPADVYFQDALVWLKACLAAPVTLS